ncbi:hypothetical protein Tco_0677805 [Tanacetum coccineum]|uniref:Uncharacterized protein n=1 Tax=Tanacetum coccineum TaxID=301880 RepID=A0ABQ4XEK7_9ASTR
MAFRSFFGEKHQTFKLQSKDGQINSVQAVDANFVVMKSSGIESGNNSSENALSKSVNETQMQMQKRNVDMGKALDGGLVVTESSGTDSDKQDTRSRLGNHTDALDADIRLVSNEEPRAGTVENADLKARIQEKVFANAILKNELRKLKGNSVDTKNSSKESYGSNDIAHNYYLEKAKKKAQDKNTNLKPREMPSARTYQTLNACTPKLRSNNQMSRNWPASKSSDVSLKVVQKADHSRNPSSFSDSKHFVCSTSQKCVFNANHDACVIKFQIEVNFRVKVQSPKTRNSNKFRRTEKSYSNTCMADLDMT